MKLEDRITCNYTGIYKITNIITSHAYIGQAKNINNRIYYHLLSTISKTRSDYDYPLHIAMRKYGLDSFELEILEKCNESELNNKEQYWIQKFHTYKYDPEYSGGYNLTAGGSQSVRHVKLFKKDVIKIRQLLAEAKLTTYEIGKLFNVSQDHISRINIGSAWHDASLSYPIRKERVIEAKNFTKVYGFNGFCILQLDKQTNEIINRFPSRSIAAKYLGGDSYGPHISQVLAGKRKSAWGYYWELEEISEEAWVELLNKFVKEA